MGGPSPRKVKEDPPPVTKILPTIPGAQGNQEKQAETVPRNLLIQKPNRPEHSTEHHNEAVCLLTARLHP